MNGIKNDVTRRKYFEIDICAYYVRAGFKDGKPVFCLWRMEPGTARWVAAQLDAQGKLINTKELDEALTRFLLIHFSLLVCAQVLPPTTLQIMSPVTLMRLKRRMELDAGVSTRHSAISAELGNPIPAIFVA